VNVLHRLIELQNQRGWSDYKIAKEAGLSPNTVSNIYRRNNTPSLTTLEALCKAFGITMSQFFAEDEMVELSPELRNLFEKWTALSVEQKNAIWQVMNTYEKI
jgi:transcriptional regulator with XRE-family HTH domain